jgi:hypothetical protein
MLASLYQGREKSCTSSIAHHLGKKSRDCKQQLYWRREHIFPAFMEMYVEASYAV